MTIKTHDKDAYFLVEHLAEGETSEGDKFSIGSNLGGGSLVYRFPEATYVVTVHAITDEVMEFRKQCAEETTGGD